MTFRRGVVLGSSAAGLIVLAIWSAPRVWAWRGIVPTAADVRAQWTPSDALLLDRNRQVLSELRVDDQRRRLEWTPLDAVSPALRAAMIASEDRRFAVHRGVDGIALLSVIGRAILGERPRGASTITMQVAAMLDASLQRNGGARTLRQKWRQMRWAWALERRWTKADILEAYLNLVTFRGEVQGVSGATRALLGKAPSGVTDGEAVVLAALVRAPNAGVEAVTRRAQLLRTATGVTVGDEEIIDATRRLLRAQALRAGTTFLAPHLARRLLPRNGSARQVQSTVDATVQQVATEALRQQLLALDGKHARDGAVLVVDNASGDVLAYVGGSGALSSGRYVDAISAHRQAGSTLKPFLYALAFDDRLLTPASLIDDSPLDVPVFGGLYRPENYDQQFNGVVSVRTALAGSLNIPAVRVLALVGADAFVAQLRRLGFAALSESGEHYGPALALGAADVSLEELVNAYRTLANSGRFSPLHFRRDGGDPSAFTRVYSDPGAFLTNSILADRDSRSVTFGLESPLATRFWSAVKTGTSKSMRDNWCIGFSERFTVGVWVGNLSGEPMRGVSGMSGAAPIWVDVMEWLHRGNQSHTPVAPAEVVAARIAVAGDPSADRPEWFISGTEPTDRIVQPVRGRERIVAPVAGAVIALDPDIPPMRQRVSFRADIATGRARWQLDGIDLGAAAETTLWAPRPGAHQLSLVGLDGAVLDRVTFAVRGSGSEM